MTPIGVMPESTRHRIHFRNVGAFRVVPEPFNDVSDDAVRVSPFLFREAASRYLKEMEGAMHLANIPTNSGVMHYVVYTENHVVHVLTSSEPQVIAITGNGP